MSYNTDGPLQNLPSIYKLPSVLTLGVNYLETHGLAHLLRQKNGLGYVGTGVLGNPPILENVPRSVDLVVLSLNYKSNIALEKGVPIAEELGGKLVITMERGQNPPRLPALPKPGSLNGMWAFTFLDYNLDTYNNTTSRLMEILQGVHRGEVSYESSVLAKITGNESDITTREIDVLNLLAKGWSNVQIAKELFISNNTVRAHVSSIISKFEAGNRTEAVVKAAELGLVEI